MRPTPQDITATITVEAPRAEVWAAVGDVRRMPDFSPELQRVFTPGGARGTGTRVVGINRRGPVLWPTTSRVVRFEPGRAIAWKVRESGATWLYELADAGDTEGTGSGARTTITARRVAPRFTSATTLLGPIIGGAAVHDRELAAGLRTTLERIKASLEARERR